MIDDSRPIFVQIAEQIENDILEGTLPEESQVPSTNDFAAFYRINPATAGKGVNRLVDEGLLYKKRGIGMFVATGARAHLLERRTATAALEAGLPIPVESAATCTADTTLRQVQARLIESLGQLEVVLDQHGPSGRVVGIVTLHDILRAEMLFAREQEE